MSITPNISEHVAKQWYLQSYDSVSPYLTHDLTRVTHTAQTTALLIYLKNHIARWFKCIDQKSFCWIYDAVTVYSVCRAFEAKQVDKLFYTVTENGQGEVTTRVPVVDSYLVFGTFTAMTCKREWSANDLQAMNFISENCRTRQCCCSAINI
jgi:hypothetical protein